MDTKRGPGRRTAAPFQVYKKDYKTHSWRDGPQPSEKQSLSAKKSLWDFPGAGCQICQCHETCARSTDCRKKPCPTDGSQCVIPFRPIGDVECK